jgi:hypothetical protein
MMENNDKTFLSEQTIGKEYQIPELVDLSNVGEALAFKCLSGSADSISCDSGSAGPG